MKKLIPLLGLMACSFPAYALADGGEFDELHDLPSDSRIKLLRYNEADVYTITTRYGYQTNVVFGAGEEIQTISVGDRSMWQIIPSNNRLFIRPMEDGVTTNMTVLTNKHSYQFDLKSISGESKSGNIYVAKFTYPEDQPKVTHMAPEPVMTVVPAPEPMVVTTTPATSPVPLRPHGATAYYEPPPVIHSAPLHSGGPAIAEAQHPNYNYTYDGPDSMAPVQVYDDGKSTFIKYRNPDMALPSPYVTDSAGHEKSVSYYIKDGTMVVATVSGTLTLKGDDGVVHVYNELLNPQ